MALIYGQLVKAQLENLASAPASTPSGIMYLNTTDSPNTFRYYDGTAWRTVVSRDATETLSGKTLTSPQINSGILATCNIDDYVDINEESAPSTPSSGKIRLYGKTDKKLYTKDSAGTETQVGASGSGELNLIENPNDSNNWTAGTGYTLATTTTAGDLPLGGTIDTAIKITSGTGASTEGTLAQTNYYTITPGAALQNKKLKCEFYLRPGSNFIDSEWTVSIYTSGGTRMALSTDSSSVTYIPNATGKFTTYFDADDTASYTARFTRTVNAGANAGVLNIVNVIVGPGIQPQGAAVGAPVSYTPTFGGFGTATNIALTQERIGTRIFINGNFQTGTVAASTAKMSLPTGYSADFTDKPNSYTVGRWARSTSTATVRRGGPLYVVSSDPTNVLFGNDDYNYAQGPIDAINGDSIAGNSETLSVYFDVNIAEWAGSGTVNLGQNDVQYISHNGSNTIYGPSGSLVPNQAFTTGSTNRTMTLTNIPTNVSPIVEIYDSANARWFNAAQIYPYVQGNNANSVNHYGIRSYWSSGSTYTVEFGNQGLNTATTTVDNGSSAWSTEYAAGTRWRIYIAQSGQAVGFGEVAQNTSGLVKSAGQLKGTNTNDSAATGYVGEYIESVESTGTAAAATSTWKEIKSITLTPGDWDVTIIGHHDYNGATLTGLPRFGLSTASASSTGMVTGSSIAYIPISNSSDIGGTTSLPNMRKSITATTTYYFNALSVYSAGSPTWHGIISARRVR